MTTETEKPNNDDADAYEGAVQKRRAILIEALARRRRMPTRKETLQALNAHMNALAFWGVTPGMIDLAVDRAIVEGRRTGKRVTVDFVTDIACDLVGERPDELVPVNVAHAASKEAVNHD